MIFKHLRESPEPEPGLEKQLKSLEQQAEIVRHAFMLRNGIRIAGVADASVYDLIVDFPGAGATASG